MYLRRTEATVWLEIVKLERFYKKKANMFGGNKIITYLCTIKMNDMPTVFNLFGYRFWFYGNDHTPIHIHVQKGGAVAKYSYNGED